MFLFDAQTPTTKVNRTQLYSHFSPALSDHQARSVLKDEV